MGKGDKKTKRGKIIMGSYGIRRPARSKHTFVAKPKEDKIFKTPSIAEVKPVEVISAVKETEQEAVEISQVVEKPKKTKKTADATAVEKKKTPKVETKKETAIAESTTETPIVENDEQVKPKAKKAPVKKAKEAKPDGDLFSVEGK